MLGGNAFHWFSPFPLKIPLWTRQFCAKLYLALIGLYVDPGNYCRAGEAKMRYSDLPTKDPLLDETVSFKTDIGFNCIVWTSERKAVGLLGQKCVPRASPS